MKKPYTKPELFIGEPLRRTPRKMIVSLIAERDAVRASIRELSRILHENYTVRSVSWNELATVMLENYTNLTNALKQSQLEHLDLNEEIVRLREGLKFALYTLNVEAQPRQEGFWTAKEVQRLAEVRKLVQP